MDEPTTLRDLLDLVEFAMVEARTSGAAHVLVGLPAEYEAATVDERTFGMDVSHEPPGQAPRVG